MVLRLSRLIQQFPASRDRAFYQRKFTNIIAKELQNTQKDEKLRSLKAAAHRMFIAMDLDKYVRSDELLVSF